MAEAQWDLEAIVEDQETTVRDLSREVMEELSADGKVDWGGGGILWELVRTGWAVSVLLGTASAGFGVRAEAGTVGLEFSLQIVLPRVIAKPGDPVPEFLENLCSAWEAEGPGEAKVWIVPTEVEWRREEDPSDILVLPGCDSWLGRFGGAESRGRLQSVKMREELSRRDNRPSADGRDWGVFLSREFTTTQIREAGEEVFARENREGCIVLGFRPDGIRKGGEERHAGVDCYASVKDLRVALAKRLAASREGTDVRAGERDKAIANAPRKVIVMVLRWEEAADIVPQPPPGPRESASALQTSPMVFGAVAEPGKGFRNSAGMGMVWVGPGTFRMGDTTGHGAANEKPVREVMITQGYWLGEAEVTQGQWRELMKNGPSHFTGDDNLPVEQVNWDDGVAFCRQLTERERSAGTLPTGCEYALPTEAEWEYACRAGTEGGYAGDLDEMGWYSSNCGRTTHLVKRKRPNARGLYDMHGNVSEWCADWHGSYAATTTINPTGPATGSERVCRGGGWIDGARFCRSACRGGFLPGFRFFYIGFRVALRSILQQAGGERKLQVFLGKTTGNETWRSDWNAFVSTVSTLIQTSHAAPAKPVDQQGGIPIFSVDAKADKNTFQGQLFDIFSGTVHWSGKIDEYSRGKLNVLVSESKIKLPRGFEMASNVSLTLKSEPVHEMKRGATVSFQAVLQRPSNDHPYSGILVIGDSISVHLIDGQLE